MTPIDFFWCIFYIYSKMVYNNEKINNRGSY